MADRYFSRVGFRVSHLAAVTYFTKSLQKFWALDLGIRLAFGRGPHIGEVDRHVGFVQRISEDFDLSEASAMVYFALGLLNANEFMWID